MLFDFQGQFHVYSFPLWYSSHILGMILTFASTTILALTLVSAESAFFGNSFAKDKKVLLRGVFVLFVVVNLTHSVLVGWKIYDHLLFSLACNCLSVFLQFVVGLFFLVTKSRMLGSIQEMAKRSIASNDQKLFSAQRRDLMRLLSFLYFAGICMFSYEALVIVRSVFELVGSVQVVLFVTSFAQLFNTCTGIFQVLSLPDCPSSGRFATACRSPPVVPTGPSSSRRHSSILISKGIDMEALLLAQQRLNS